MLFSQILNNKGLFHSSYLQDDMANLLDSTFEFPESFQTSVFKVTPEYIARPDLLASDIYGDESYSDILCKINGISNPYELNEGMYLMIPSQMDIQRFVVQPSVNWRETAATPLTSNGEYSYDSPDSTITQLPIPKARNSKDRRPNEAVIGDKRFNIDPISKIVIY